MRVILDDGTWNKKKSVNVSSFADAAQTVRKYISDWNLGCSVFTGGEVFDGLNRIARVSYNGRVWNNSGDEIQVT